MSSWIPRAGGVDDEGACLQGCDAFGPSRRLTTRPLGLLPPVGEGGLRARDGVKLEYSALNVDDGCINKPKLYTRS